MSLDKVKAYFTPYGMTDRIREFDCSSETVAFAAAAIGCEPKQIVKTMAFMVEGKPMLIAMAGDARIANPKYKEQFHDKASLLPPEQVEARIGHEIGGVCPFAINEGVSVYLDISLKRAETLFPGAGSGNSVMALTLSELEKHAHSKAWIDVCKDWA